MHWQFAAKGLRLCYYSKKKNFGSGFPRVTLFHGHLLDHYKYQRSSWLHLFYRLFLYRNPLLLLLWFIHWNTPSTKNPLLSLLFSHIIKKYFYLVWQWKIKGWFLYLNWIFIFWAYIVFIVIKCIFNFIHHGEAFHNKWHISMLNKFIYLFFKFGYCPSHTQI